MRVWHIAVLLAAGLAVGMLYPWRFTALFGDATLYYFLPALIFEAAWHLDTREMRARAREIALLAGPGVIVTAAVIAVACRYGGGTSWPIALVLGATLSATDPVAVIAIFRRLRVPQALATVVESEALLNDAVAVVLFRAILAAVATGAAGGALWRVAGSAALGVLLGIAAGVILAWIAAMLLTHAGSGVQTVATLVGAYAGYFFCDRAGWSGIFCVIAFGLALHRLERRHVAFMIRREVERAWSVLTTFANAALFFLIGAAFDVARVDHALRIAGVTLGAVLVSRALLAHGVLPAVSRGFPRAWQSVVRMAGIRGALCLALILALPRMSGSGFALDAVFFVVVVTVAAGALALAPRLARLQL